MSLLSFDVGIINLAYCIIDKDERIKDWGIIGLVDGNPKTKCSRKTQQGKACTRKAFHILENGKGCCIKHLNKDEDENYSRNATVENATEYELKKKLFAALDELAPMTTEVTRILIEKQPKHAREKIKGIAHALFDYYVMNEPTEQPYEKIDFIDAKNKLTVYDGPPISCHLKTQYARNKWYGLRYCLYLLDDEEEENWKQFISKHKKKDDLADCYLQGVWYLRFGQFGKKPPISSSHQKLVFKQNNIIKYKKIRAYKPKPNKQKLTLGGLKHVLTRKTPEITDKVHKAVEFFFGEPLSENLLKELS